PPPDLVENPTEAYADPPEDDELDAADERDEDDQRRPSLHHALDDDLLVHHPEAVHESQHRDQEANIDRKIQWGRRKRDDPVDGKAEHLAEAVFRRPARSAAGVELN